MGNDFVMVPRTDLVRLQENMDPHRGAVAWGIVCDLLAKPAETVERAAFEAWYIRDVGPGLANLSRINTGSRAYEDEDAMSAWEGWQARAALERKP